MKVGIRRIGLSSLGQMGCLLGVVAAFLPSLLCGLLGIGFVTLARDWLESWKQIPVSLLGRQLTTLDFVQLLGLEGTLETLQVLSAASVAVLLLSVLVMALVSGLLLAVITILVGLAYNLLAAATGGIVVEMAPKSHKAPPE
ncbi:MAG: hypothetical protein ACP5JJ_04080 [Anaerolineae bacterium]